MKDCYRAAARGIFHATQSESADGGGAAAAAAPRLAQWRAQGRFWQAKLPIVQEGLHADDPTEAAGSWLRLFPSTSEAGCILCRGYRCKVGTLRLPNLKRHHRSKAHIKQVKSFLRHAVGPTGRTTAGSPSKEDFCKVWDSIASGQTPASALVRQKVEKIQWLLGESIFTVDRRAIAAAASIAIARDESKGALVVRFSCTSEKLEQRSGILGIVRGFGQTASAVTRATQAVFKEFCTPNPRGRFGGGGALQMSNRLYNHLNNKIEFMTTDAALNELLSARLMPTGPNPLTPNLKMCLRDYAHGSRRIISRPFHADPFLNRLHSTFIASKRSICQRIEHSHIFKSIFAEKVKDQPVNTPPVRNLSAAKHRYESYAKPTGRFVHQQLALIATASTISVMRPGKTEGNDANAYLEALDNESYLQMAMMADAEDEGLLLTRQCDQEDVDLAEVSHFASMFLERIVCLFQGDAKCFTITGYTKFAMELLQTPRNFFLKGGVLRTLGGAGHPSEAVKQRCVQRMVAWTHLAVAVVRAEFPDFEVVMSFDAFSLNEGRRCSDDVDNASVRRLAKAFGVSAEALAAQLRDHRRMAIAGFKQGAGTFAAWKQAVQRTQSRASLKQLHPVDALLPVLIRYGTFKGSTSGVEQVNGACRRLLCHRTHAEDSVQCRIVKVAVSKGVPDSDVIVGVAQEKWAKYFGLARQPRGRRLDLGKPRRSATGRQPEACSVTGRQPEARSVTGRQPEALQRRGLPTEKGFLQARRQDLGTATEARKPEAAAADTRGSWEEGHSREELYQRRKRFTRKFSAMQQGMLLDEELTEGFQRNAAKFAKTQTAEDRRRGTAETRLAARVAPSGLTFADCQNKSVYMQRVPAQPADLERLLRTHAHVVNDRGLADIFLVPNVASPSDHIHWHAVLRGCHLMSHQVVLQGKGPAIKFEAANQKPRWLFLSRRFKTQHPQICTIITHCAGRFRVLGSKSEFMRVFEKVKAPAKAPQMSRLLLVLSLREDISKGPTHAKLSPIVGALALLQRLRRVDAARSTLGYCSM